MERASVIINADNECECRAGLLARADTLELTLVDNSVPHKHFWFIEIYRQAEGEIVNPDTLAVFKKLEPWFMRKETNNLAYGGCLQGKRAHFDHYYFRLSNEIKEMLNRQTLIWDGFSPSIFYGFEDPMFYDNDELIGYGVSHHRSGILYL